MVVARRLQPADFCTSALPRNETLPRPRPQTLRVNLFSCFNVLRPAVKAMMRQPTGGSIAFCSSAVARHGIPNHEAIAAAKAGVQGAPRARARARLGRWGPRLLSRPGRVSLLASPALHAPAAAAAQSNRIAPPNAHYTVARAGPQA